MAAAERYCIPLFERVLNESENIGEQIKYTVEDQLCIDGWMAEEKKPPLLCRLILALIIEAVDTIVREHTSLTSEAQNPPW